jgi:hypothetical protein
MSAAAAAAEPTVSDKFYLLEMEKAVQMVVDLHRLTQKEILYWTPYPALNCWHVVIRIPNARTYLYLLKQVGPNEWYLGYLEKGIPVWLPPVQALSGLVKAVVARQNLEGIAQLHADAIRQTVQKREEYLREM